MIRAVSISVAAVAAGAVALVGVNQLTGSSDSWKGSLNASIVAASSGDTITVPAGSYPSETIAPEAKTIRVEAAGATFGSLTLTGVKNLTLNGITVNGLFTLRASPVLGTVSAASLRTANVLVSNASLKTFLFRNVDGVALLDSQVGGTNQSLPGCGSTTSPCGVAKIGGYPSAVGAPYMPSTNVVIDNVFFHDIIRTVTGTAHAECLFFDGGTDGVKVTDSWFTNCGVFDIFGGPSSAGGIANVTVDSNLLDVPRDTVGGAAPSATNFKGGATNLVFRQNSVLGGLRFDTASYPGLVKERNAFAGFVSASVAPCDLTACYRNDLHVTAGTDGVPVSTPPTPVTTETTPTTTVSPTAPLAVTPSRIYFDLKWSGLTGDTVSIYRNGLKVVASTANDGAATTGAPTGASYTYWIRDSAGTDTAKVTVQG